jgi:hypothetical protein
MAFPAFAHEGHNDADEKGSMNKTEMAPVTVKGEVLDLACYIDHGAQGAKHADCAKTCAVNGLPVGFKGENGKTYFLIGEHKPINNQLAQYAGKTITVRGKEASRDGINMLENVEVVQ